MQESKYQIKNWKRWKDSKRLLSQTKNELMKDIKAITYTNELPGGKHSDIASKYNKLIEDVKIYDEYIHAYDVLIWRLENAIATLLNEEQRKVIIIYANNSDSKKREDEALKEGLSRTNFYAKLSESFDILDSILVLDPKENNELLKKSGLI